MTLEGQWAIHHPNDLSLPQSFSEVSCQGSRALRKSAFSFFIPSLFTSYLCGCPEVSEKVVLCLDLSQLNSTLFPSTSMWTWSHIVKFMAIHSQTDLLAHLSSGGFSLLQSSSQLLPLHCRMETLMQVTGEWESLGPKPANPCEQPPWLGFSSGWDLCLGMVPSPGAEPTWGCLELTALMGPAGLNQEGWQVFLLLSCCG